MKTVPHELYGPLTNQEHHLGNASLGVSFTYRQVSNIRRTKTQHLKDSRTFLRLSMTNTLKPDVESRMKM